jgi:hypothetical protein
VVILESGVGFVVRGGSGGKICENDMGSMLGVVWLCYEGAILYYFSVATP